MKNYTYQNSLIGKKQLRQLLAWSFTNYDSMQACSLADELKYLGFKYATQAGISINLEDLKVPPVKNRMLKNANQEIRTAEKLYFKGKITDIERFQTILDTWSQTSESLKEQVVFYFKNYDPLNSVYLMAFSGARGNLSQVRQLVGMRGLMSDPSGQIMNLAITKNFREGLSITDYLMSGYGARKGIIDTALKTANSGYLTRRLIDVGQDIIIREKDCFTTHSFLVTAPEKDFKTLHLMYEKLVGRVISKSILDPNTHEVWIERNTPITPDLIEKWKEKKIREFYIRSPFTCQLYRAICQKCYGWDLANENLVDIGEAVGILAGQSIGEPGTQLTMRTFHTGGVFTSEARQTILSPVNGIIKLSKFLQTVPVRTNRGENVFLTKNSGSLILIPADSNRSLIQLDILKNTLIFPKNNQYVEKDTLIGEVLKVNKQIKSEIKPILSDTAGEIVIPKLKRKANLVHKNKLIWILRGQLYKSPKHSFPHFYPDYKVKRDTAIFRTKIVSHYPGKIEFHNQKGTVYQRSIRIRQNKYFLSNSSLKELNTPIQSKTSVLLFNNFKYLVTVESKTFKSYLKLARNQQIGTLLTNVFQTLTGGRVYYDHQTQFKGIPNSNTISYLNRSMESDLEEEFDLDEELESQNDKSVISHRTLIWFGEEIHSVNCDPTVLLVEPGDFIAEGFELIPGRFSKTSGIVEIQQTANLVQTISIKSGIVYEGTKLKDPSKKFYYPGELILSNIYAPNLSFCEHLSENEKDQLLVRPIEIYEVAHPNSDPICDPNKMNRNSNLKLETELWYAYKSNQMILGAKNLKLVSEILRFEPHPCWKNMSKMEVISNLETNRVEFQIHEKLSFLNYIPPKLRYKNLESSFLFQSNQFVDRYTVLGYVESLIFNTLEIVQLKVKREDITQLLLISNEDCFTIPKKQFPKKKVNDFIVDSSNLHETGKVILSNDQFLTLQKGKPYFFPNCKTDSIMDKTTLQYQIFPSTRTLKAVETEKRISLNYYDMTKSLVQRPPKEKEVLKRPISMKAEFSQLFIKKNGKLYSSLIPEFFKKLSISPNHKKFQSSSITRPTDFDSRTSRKLQRTIFLRSSQFGKKQSNSGIPVDSELVLMRVVEHPFAKSAKSIGLYSITEDYFEQDSNSVFCKNTEFIEAGETIGLLNLEKEITEDIVQGLPRVEEVLEARKKNLLLKRIPTNQKKGLLIQKPSLDPNFDFRKLGTPVKENEKINPHKLLKVYFHYYGFLKLFICDRTKKAKYSRFIQNYEGSYKSFKQVQSFMLNSVQSVYESQGVSINDKHLEVVIKQMTTKVLITYEGNTPLLRREVIDLYHIQYMNQIVQLQGKQPAYYVPLLLGITKAALNNPSFISAASFQETTRVLTKAGIEGRIDWLRGLKENIIIGHLIPAGTGSPTYRSAFQRKVRKDASIFTPLPEKEESVIQS